MSPHLRAPGLLLAVVVALVVLMVTGVTCASIKPQATAGTRVLKNLKLHDRKLLSSDDPFEHPAEPPTNPYVDVVAPVIKQGKAVILTGAGLSAQLIALGPQTSASDASDLSMTIASWTTFIQSMITKLVQLDLADPNVSIWAFLATDCWVPIGITGAEIHGNLTQLGGLDTTYSWPKDKAAAIAASKKVAAVNPAWEHPDLCTLGAEFGATLVEEQINLKTPKDQLAGVKVTFRANVEQQFNARRISATPYNSITPALATLAKRAPIITTNYDTFAEQALGLRSLDYSAVINNPVKFINSDEAKTVVTHLHGFVDNIGDFVITMAEYNKTQKKIVKWMVPVLRNKSAVIVGSASGIFDQHFLAIWKALQLEGSTNPHYLLLRASEMWIIDNMALLEDKALGLWMYNNIKVMIYGRTFTELPVFLEAVSFKLSLQGRESESLWGAPQGGTPGIRTR